MVCTPVPLMMVVSARVICPRRSSARRPVYRMPGNTSVPLTTLYPSAMLPLRSMAMLPIQRCTPSPGAKVPCCCTLYRPCSVRWISYQRIPATPGAASTDWLVTIVSASSSRR